MRPHKKASIHFRPRFSNWPERGVYQIFFRLSVASTLQIGRLGAFTFPPGEYVYTGRASRNLPKRVLRHATGGKRLHWHIDYLLRSDAARIERVELKSENPAEECRVNAAAARGRICVAPGFGASDCAAGCAAHLWHSKYEAKGLKKIPGLTCRA